MSLKSIVQKPSFATRLYRMKNLYIFGAGELASIAKSYFEDYQNYVPIGFIVDDSYSENIEGTKDGLPIHFLSEVESNFHAKNSEVFVAISASRMNCDRQEVFVRLEEMGFTLATFVSPHAFVSPSARIGKNVMIFENNVVQNGVSIDHNSILWSGNHIGHHTSIGRNCFLSSHVVISGYCEIGENCYFGVNSTVIDHIKIAPYTLIGAASLVTKDTMANSIYVGSPAKQIAGKDPLSVNFR